MMATQLLSKLKTFVSIFSVVIVAGCSQYMDPPASVAPLMIIEAEKTLHNFRKQDDLKVIDQHLKTAAGVLILPRVVKGGMFGAAEAGTGVLLARTNDGWSYPAFYLLGAGSFGLQMGIQETAVVMIIRNHGALEAILENQGKLGADMGVMIGLHGIGFEGSTTTNMGADIIAIVGPGVGLFGGVSLEGAVLVRRNDLNEYFYGPGAVPRSIVIEGRYTNPVADGLRMAIEPD